MDFTEKRFLMDAMISFGSLWVGLYPSTLFNSYKQNEIILTIWKLQQQSD